MWKDNHKNAKHWEQKLLDRKTYCLQAHPCIRNVTSWGSEGVNVQQNPCVRNSQIKRITLSTTVDWKCDSILSYCTHTKAMHNQWMTYKKRIDNSCHTCCSVWRGWGEMNKTNLEGRHDKGSIPDSGRKGKRVRTRVTMGYVCVWVAGVSAWGVGGILWLKLQTLVYGILPSTTAVFSYAIGSRKLPANEQFFCWCWNSSKFVTNNSNDTNDIRRLFYNWPCCLRQLKQNQHRLNRDGTLFSPGVDASHVYVLAWALGCFHSLSTQTFRRVLTASAARR